MSNSDIFGWISPHLFWLVTEKEAIIEFGLAEATADCSDGAVVRGAAALPPKLEELRLPGHVLGERFET